MKQARKLAALAAALCLLCSSCATSAGTHAKSYFSNSGTIVSTLFSGGKVSSDPSGDSGTTAASTEALDTPTDFVMEEDGSYSFTGVEGASYYLLYFCAPDTAEDDDSFIYSSEPITASTENESYTGNYLDVLNAAYGEYLVRVVACPALGDTEHSMSAFASTQFTATGTQSNPSLEYFWDPFSGTISFQLSNVGEYTYQAYPDKLDVTCTNDNDSGDVVTATLTEVTEENVDLSMALMPGETYTITAYTVSDSPYVTNQTSETVTVAQSITMGDLNILSAGYSYSHGMLNYPLLWENFNPEKGGPVGDMVGFAGAYTFDCTPTTVSAGSAYTYDMSVYYIDQGHGTLELYEDGTLQLSQTGFGPISASSIGGIWLENGDGTVTLCFDHSSVTLS